MNSDQHDGGSSTPNPCRTCRTRAHEVFTAQTEVARLARQANFARPEKKAQAVDNIATAKAARDRAKGWLDEHTADCEHAAPAP